MALSADIQEVRTLWRTAPWRVRVFLGLSAFLASSGIASLSETVFKWKGFILDGVQMYQKYISAPLTEFLQTLVARSVPIGLADYCFVLGLLTITFVRLAIWWGAKWYDFAIIMALLNWYGFVVQFAFSGIQDLNATVAWIGYAIAVAMVLYFSRGALRILAVAWLLVPVFGLALLAAINSGLTRSAA